jgi:putative membrane protein
MKSLFATAAFLAAAALSTASAQEEAPTTTPTAAPSPTPAPTRTPAAGRFPSAKSEVEKQRKRDSTFMARAQHRALEETELSRIVSQKGSNSSVHSLALRILDDRGKTGESLRLFAESQGASLPSALESARQAEVDRISRLPSDQIDRAYLAAMLRTHDADVADFQGQAEASQEVELQAWVYDTLPVLEDHQAEIHRIADELGVRPAVSLIWNVSLTAKGRRYRARSAETKGLR